MRALARYDGITRITERKLGAVIPRLIATDLDGTFLDSTGRYDALKFDQQLAAMKARDIRFVVTTGDPLDHAQSLFCPLKQRHEITYVVEDGALITSANGQVLKTAAIAPSLWLAAVTWLKREPIMADCFILACGWKRSYTQLAADSQRFRDSQEFYPSLTHVDQLATVGDAILKLDLTWLKSDITAQVAAFNRHFAGSLVATSSGLGGMNVTLPGVNKAAALDFLGDRWQIGSAQMAAFGDSGNDLAMLQQVGQGFAVANAAPEVLAGAPQRLQHTNDQGAVCEQIDQWLV